ncbi:hypothetical protein P692DRAFT_20364836 [Suillus brevipes Sb2]|nr:hypothetical protein P692DRAFT_20364836 [Suillus brevipes Sb2]
MLPLQVLRDEFLYLDVLRLLRHVVCNGYYLDHPKQFQQLIFQLNCSRGTNTWVAFKKKLGKTTIRSVYTFRPSQASSNQGRQMNRSHRALFLFDVLAGSMPCCSWDAYPSTPRRWAKAKVWSPTRDNRTTLWQKDTSVYEPSLFANGCAAAAYHH